MSICDCGKPDKLMISDEVDDDKCTYIRCCVCGGKFGILDMKTNVIEICEKNKKTESIRYISKSNRYVVLNRQRWCCNMCGCRLKYSSNSDFPGEVAHIDHIIPFSERERYIGDINSPENLQALCPACNLSKGKKKIH